MEDSIPLPKVSGGVVRVFFDTFARCRTGDFKLLANHERTNFFVKITVVFAVVAAIY